MTLWRFLDYVAEDGRNLMREWYDIQTPQVKAQCDATLLLLAATKDWETPEIEEFKVLVERHAVLSEIRFHVSITRTAGKSTYRKRFRIAGDWPARDGCYVLLVGATKVRGVYSPHLAFDIAMRLKQDLSEGKGKTVERF